MRTALAVGLCIILALGADVAFNDGDGAKAIQKAISNALVRVID